MLFKSKIQHFDWKLQIVAGATLALTLGGFGALRVAAQAQQAGSSNPLANEVYLYGETPQPNQVHKGYMVFSRQNEKVVGAFYSPRSEFTCFTGSQTSKTLDVAPISVDGTKNPEVKVELNDLHPIPKVSSNDQRILSACKQTVALVDN